MKNNKREVILKIGVVAPPIIIYNVVSEILNENYPIPLFVMAVIFVALSILFLWIGIYQLLLHKNILEADDTYLYVYTTIKERKALLRDIVSVDIEKNIAPTQRYVHRNMNLVIVCKEQNFFIQNVLHAEYIKEVLIILSRSIK